MVAMGPETFLSLLPLKLEAQDVSQVNAWLFPILKQYTVGSSLNFFTESIFDMIGLMKKKSAAVCTCWTLFLLCLLIKVTNLVPCYFFYSLNEKERFIQLGVLMD